jgi:hypothetical protein
VPSIIREHQSSATGLCFEARWRVSKATGNTGGICAVCAVKSQSQEVSRMSLQQLHNEAGHVN